MNVREDMILSRRSTLKLLAVSGAAFSTGCLPEIGNLIGLRPRPSLDVKFLRSLSGLTPRYPIYDADKDLARAIVKWCENILLAGKYWNLSLNQTSVFQLPSKVFNAHVYVISVDCGEKISQILSEADVFQENLEEIIGTRISDLDVVGGVLNLSRKLHYDPEPNKERGLDYDSRRFTVGDTYWLDVYVRKQEEEKEVVIPILRIYPGFVAAYYYRPISEPELASFYNDLVEYFPEPDEVVLDWHELAAVLGIERTRVYLQACFNGAGIMRKIYASYDGSQNRQTHPPLVVYDDPTDNDIPVYYRVWMDMYPLNPIYVPGASAPYEVSSLEDSTLEFSAFDLRKVIKLWRLDYEYVHIRENPVPIPEAVPEEELERPGEAWRLSHKFTKITDVPRPPFPNTVFGLATVKLLIQESRGHAAYLGEGLFRMKASDLTRLAAGSGNWGSPETGAVIIVVEGAKAGAGVSFVSSIIGIGAGVYKRWKKGEIDDELATCYEKPFDYCKMCVMISEGYKVNKVQKFAGTLAFAGGLISLAICAATAGVGCAVVAALAAVGGVWSMIDSHGVTDDLLRDCEHRI